MGTTNLDTLQLSGGLGINGQAPAAPAAHVAAAPAGGTGATAGAYDTAQNRDAMIALVNAMRTALINHGIMASS